MIAVGTTVRIVGGHSCFYIDSVTGFIHVKANLKISPCTQSLYTLYVVAEDDSSPPRQSSRVRVDMEILRNSPPTITNLPRNVTIGK